MSLTALIVVAFIAPLCLRVVTGNYVVPNEVYIGGLFNPVISEPDYFQIELVSAFVQAIEEINARSDILPSTELKYMIRSGSGVEDASYAGIEMVRSSYNVSAFVGGLSNAETSALHQVFIDTKKVMAHSVASSAMFANPMNYPYKVQTNAIDSRQGNVIQHMMCSYFNYTRAVVFATFDDYGSKSIIELTDGEYCSLDILATVTFPTFENNFVDYIDQVLPLDATVFILLMNYTNAGILLEEGYNMGLFVEGTQIIGSSTFLDPLLFKTFSRDADIPSIMKGIVVPQYYPSNYLIENSADSRFLSGWRSRYSSKNNCSHIVDSTGYHFLFPNGDTSKTCYGLNFQEYFTNGSNMNSYAALTYDATYLIAHGIDNLTRSGIEISGDSLLAAIFSNVSFVGATGLIEISAGEQQFDNYGRGDRMTGFEYRIFNFVESGYLISPNKSFVSVGIWNPVRGDLSCPSYDTTCSSIVYNTHDNSMPSCFPPFAYAKPPSVIKIGALFSPFDEYGNVDKVQVENLAAFLLAVKVINNKTDGVADDLLPNTELRFSFKSAIGFSGAVLSGNKMLTSFYGSGILGAVNGLPNLETMAAAQLFGDNHIVQSHSMGMDSALGFAGDYPFKVQTCPVDSFEGVAIQDIVCRYFGYTKVSIFSTSDNFGTMTTLEFQDDTYCGNVILSSHSFLTDTTDYSSAIADAMAVGAQVFLFFLPPMNAAMLLEQGYYSGLFHEGTQVISSSKAAVPEIFRYFTPSAPVKSIMKGFISMEYWPQYSLTRTSEGEEFLRLWRNQQNTLGRVVNGRYLCNQQRDDDGAEYLFLNPANHSHCAGLNFSSYNGTENLNPFAALTYDATFLLAHGFDSVLRKGEDINGPNLLEALLFNVSFVGATGDIALDEGSDYLDHYAQGNREGGHHYRFRNFQGDAYDNNPNDSFVIVGTWGFDIGCQICEDPSVCSTIIYNTGDGGPASQSPPDIILSQPMGSRAFLYALSAVVLIAVLIIGIMTFRYQNTKLVKASQPIMLYFLLFGEVLAGIRVLFGGLPLTTNNCIAGLWMGHLAFAFVFGALFVKTWRVNKIINNTTLKRIKVTNKDVAIMMSLGIFGVCIYLALLTGIGQPHLSFSSSTTRNQTTKDPRCGMLHSEFHTALFAFEALMLITGARLCYAVKDVPDAVNESKHIASAMTSILLISFLVFPIVFLISLPHSLQQLIQAVEFALASLMTLFIFFVPLLLKVSGDKKRGMSDDDVILGSSTKSGVGPAKISPTDEYSHSETFVLSFVALKKVSEEERLAFCLDQVNKWRATMLQMEARMSGSGGPNTSSHHDMSQHSVSKKKDGDPRLNSSRSGRTEASASRVDLKSQLEEA